MKIESVTLTDVQRSAIHKWIQDPQCEAFLALIKSEEDMLMIKGAEAALKVPDLALGKHDIGGEAIGFFAEAARLRLFIDTFEAHADTDNLASYKISQ